MQAPDILFPRGNHTARSGVLVKNPMNDDMHFNTFETDFFQQGDDSAGLPFEAERFEDLEDSRKRSHALFSRRSLLIVGASMAVLGCAALWRGRSHTSPPVVAAKTEAVPAAVPAPVKTATPPPEPTPLAVAKPPVEAIQNLPAPARIESPVAQVAPPAVPVALVAPAAQVVPVAQAAPAAAAAAQAAPMAAPVAQAASDDAQARCKDAIRSKRSKDILGLCPAAVSDDPIAAEIAVALAKIEFDRGRSMQASAWSKRAIAANPDAADAYVFLGGAEQNAGHGKAAKQAYQHYLRLAPTGRYAADLRAIVNSL